MTRRRLAQELAVVAGFENPRAPLEQYHTPPDLAAHLVHVADLNGDVEDRTVVDLGCGTGMLALGAALRGPRRVVGIDIDPAALSTAHENERRVGASADVGWVRADATSTDVTSTDGTSTNAANVDGTNADGTNADETSTDGTHDEAMDIDETPEQTHDETGSRTAYPPLWPDEPVTVVMNPPFGAQRGSEHADRAFLETAAGVAGVSYSVHNEGSQEFVESFADDEGGEVTHAFRAELDLPRQFDFHEEASRVVDVEVYRIVWQR